VGEEVIIWANKVGPHNNPQETYKYHSLPFCKPEVPSRGIRSIPDSLGSFLEGNDLVDSLLKVSFQQNVESTIYCEANLNVEQIKMFAHAVRKQYWYQMYIGKESKENTTF